jgi:uncharacterized coiled-coil DUF342 family protein
MPKKAATKSVSEIGSSCTFCNIKDIEIDRLKVKLQELENKIEGKPKKEYTEEELAAKKIASDAKRDEKNKQVKEYFDTIELNKKLKHELLTRFGVSL